MHFDKRFSDRILAVATVCACRFATGLRLVLAGAFISFLVSLLGTVPAQAVDGQDTQCRSALRGFECHVGAKGDVVLASLMRHDKAVPKPSSVRKIRFSLEIEASLGISAVETQREIAKILADSRGWGGDGRIVFVPSTPKEAHLRFLIAKPANVDRMCRPLRTLGYLSCRRGRRVILNSDRWEKAIHHWDRSVAEYRAYLVNHETGHYLGFQHVGCRGRGAMAPVMMQQTKSRRGCIGNGWPFPNRQREAMNLSRPMPVLGIGPR